MWIILMQYASAFQQVTQHNDERIEAIYDLENEVAEPQQHFIYADITDSRIQRNAFAQY